MGSQEIEGSRISQNTEAKDIGQIPPFKFFGRLDDQLSREFQRSVYDHMQNYPEQLMPIVINSPGGSLKELFEIVDLKNNLGTKFETTALSARSAGAVILGLGEKNHRKAYPFAKIMIHQPKMNDFKITATTHEFMNFVESNIDEDIKYFNLIAAPTQKTFEEVFEATKGKDLILTPLEAIEFGLIDEIIELPHQTTSFTF